MDNLEDGINPKTNEERLGDYLKSAREELKLSLSDVTNETKIRKFYLECFESNDLAPLPADVTSRGFLKAIALFLKLDPHVVLSKFDEEKGIFELDEAMDESTFRPSLMSKRRKLLNSFYLTILLLLLFVISYVLLS